MRIDGDDKKGSEIQLVQSDQESINKIHYHFVLFVGRSLPDCLTTVRSRAGCPRAQPAAPSRLPLGTAHVRRLPLLSHGSGEYHNINPY